ncbi:protocadherin gamma-A2-like [Synchiropus picturatus]
MYMCQRERDDGRESAVVERELRMNSIRQLSLFGFSNWAAEEEDCSIFVPSPCFSFNLSSFFTMDLQFHVQRWLLLLLLSTSCRFSRGEVRYVLPEEMQRGSVIGNVARDLGLRATNLEARRARIVAEGTRQLCELDAASGNLLISQRIDREELCAQTSTCVIQYQLLLEDPLQAHSLVLDITDINDNSPAFATGEIKLDLVESTVLGRRFPLESAYDPDLGTNSVHNYKLSPNNHFALEMSTQINGNSYPELVLKSALDREAQAGHILTISGIDGGKPARTGTASIHIRVLDANDNVPVFSQRVYKASVAENSFIGTVVAKLNATDSDEGVYGDITYSFSHLSDMMAGMFEINPSSGEVRVAGAIDYEEASTHELDVQAKDGGGQASHCKLIIDVIDENDNRPVIEIKSATAEVPENSESGTMVSLINIYDLDTGNNGHVTCSIPDNVPFKFVSEVKNYYMLVTDGELDREQHSEYSIAVTATDAGSPSLSSVKVLTIVVNDVNDNKPVFPQNEFNANILENQPVGTFVTTIKANDMDDSSNAKLVYQISRDTNLDASSSLTINSETGELFTSRQFDYEESAHFQIKVIARDGGDPPLSSTCTVNVFIKDQNDNAPTVLYPVQNFVAEDMVPLEAPRGYLVTKVVAVDSDSGHNAWLSFRIIKATQPNLFTVGLHTGEIRTLRVFMEDDEPKQTLVVLVSDNGQESLSATATVSLLIGDGLPVLQELFEFSEESESSENLRFYLIIALFTVSTLLIILIVLVFYCKLCRRRYTYRSPSASLPVFPTTYYTQSFTDFSRCGTLLKDDRYDPFMTTASWRGDFRFSSSTDTDTLKKRSAAYQKNTLRRVSADRASLKTRGAPQPCYMVK